jgi:hypothetical protein
MICHCKSTAHWNKIGKYNELPATESIGCGLGAPEQAEKPKSFLIEKSCIEVGRFCAEQKVNPKK